MKKNAIIIDDERLARNELKKMLAVHPEIEIIGEAVNADEGLRLINEFNPDLIFLDVQMPVKTGFDLLEELEKVPTVVFTTAYDEYAIRAFEVNALDYLLKPIDPKRLSDAVQKFLAIDEKEMLFSENRSEIRLSLSESDQVFVKDGEKCWFVRLDRVRLCESMGNYVRLFFDDQKPLVLKSLNALEDRLDPKVFFRANRKHIINLNYIEKIEPWFSGGLQVTLVGKGEKIEISRRQSIRFKELLSL